MNKQIENMGGDGYLEMMPTEAYDTMASMLGGNGPQEYTEDKDNANASTYIKDEQIEAAKKIDGIKVFNALPNSTADYVTSKKTDKRYRINLNLVVEGINFDMSNGVSPNTDKDAGYEIAINEDLAKALGYENVADIVGETVQIAVPSNLTCYTAIKRSECQTILDVKVSGTQAPGILSMGGSGVISVLSNVMPAQTHEMCQRFFEGDLAGAAKLQMDYLPLINALFSEVNPIPVKAAMAAMGWCENYLRMPLTRMEPEHWEKLKTIMQAHKQI